ncbi:unnamed protein product [Pleuronectes platessa]|uniref:Proline-rich transmembrane protein 3/4 domain-containing protein n=1 Tax=Pleuronectes platessa TaxID=8262 RepID=A0A9N7YHW5_PLEPL|nr:unnamed protein product [Pleuronectes platessa]
MTAEEQFKETRASRGKDDSLDGGDSLERPVQTNLFTSLTNRNLHGPGGPCVLGLRPCVVLKNQNGTNLLWDDMSRTLAFVWELHVFGCASLFILMAVLAVLGMASACILPHSLCHALTLENSLLVMGGTLRGVLLLLDPYGTHQILSRATLAALHNVPLQLLLWAQVALALTLSLFWGLPFCMGILSQSLSYRDPFLMSSVPQWFPSHRIDRRAKRVTAVCAVFGVLCCSLQMYSLLWIYGLLGNWRRFGWGWWLSRLHFRSVVSDDGQHGSALPTRYGSLTFMSAKEGDEKLAPVSHSLMAAKLKHLDPSVQCSDNLMTLRVKRRGAPHVLVNSGVGPLTPLSQMPSSCGSSVKRSRRDVAFAAPYQGCHVSQQGGDYVLPLRLWGKPMAMSCPAVLPPPSVSCFPTGMVVKFGGIAANNLRVKAHTPAPTPSTVAPPSQWLQFPSDPAQYPKWPQYNFFPGPVPPTQSSPDKNPAATPETELTQMPHSQYDWKPDPQLPQFPLPPQYHFLPYPKLPEPQEGQHQTLPNPKPVIQQPKPQPLHPQIYQVPVLYPPPKIGHFTACGTIHGPPPDPTQCPQSKQPQKNTLFTNTATDRTGSCAFPSRSCAPPLRCLGAAQLF